MMRKILLFAAATAAALCLMTQDVNAGTRRGLDVVVIVDHSGSMNGSRLCPLPNDKDNKRIEGTRNLIFRLADDADIYNLTHRISVIDFGSNPPSPETILSSYTIRPGAGKLAKAIAVKTVKPRGHMGNTNTPSAMEAGRRELSKMAASDPSRERDRKMVIITDGRPYDGSDKYRYKLYDKITEISSRLKTEGVEIRVMGINDVTNYWLDGDGSFWEKITGNKKRAVLVDPAARIDGIVNLMMDEWFGAETEFIVPKKNETYICPPYLRRLVFNLSFRNSNGDIAITDPNGNQIYTSTGKSISLDMPVRIPLDDPMPGFYQITRSDSLSCSITYEKYSADVKRIEPGAQVRFGHEVRIVFQVYDSTGGPAKFYQAYPLKNLKIVVDTPSGAIEKLPASMPRDADGKFEAKWKPKTPGIHHITLKGEVDLGKGVTLPLFHDNPRSYDTKLEVIKTDPVYLQIEKPDLTGTVRILPWNKKVDLAISLLNAKKEKLSSSDVKNVVSEPERWLKLEPIDEFGNRPADASPIPCVYDADSGVFATEIPVTFDWIHGQGWIDPAEVRFRLVPEPGKIASGFYLDSLYLPPEIESLRVRGDNKTAGPLKIGYSLMVFLLPFLIILILAAGVIWFLLVRYIPDRQIQKEDTANKVKPAIKIYDMMADPGGYGAPSYPVGGKQRFKFDRGVKFELDGIWYIADKFRVRRIPASSAKASAEVIYRWKGSKTDESVMLDAGKAKSLKGLPVSHNLSIVLETSTT